MKKLNKENLNVFFILLIIILIILLPISFYLGRKIATQEQNANNSTENSLSTENIHKDTPITGQEIQSQAQELIDKYFNPLKLTFDGEYEDIDKTYITFYYYQFSPNKKSTLKSCKDLYSNVDYAQQNNNGIFEGDENIYIINLRNGTATCNYLSENLEIIKYKDINEYAQLLFGPAYNLPKKDIIEFDQVYDYIDETENYIKFNPTGFGGTTHVTYEITKAELYNKELKVSMDYQNGDIIKYTLDIIFKKHNNNSYYLDKVTRIK